MTAQASISALQLGLPAIAFGLGGAAVALVLASRADSAPALAAALIAAGALGSSANAASGRAVVSWFAPDRRGFALGLRHMATPLGGAVAAALLPLAVHRGGIGAAMLALACACLVGSLVAALGLRRPEGGEGEREAGDPGPLRDPAICACPSAPRASCSPSSRF